MDFKKVRRVDGLEAADYALVDYIIDCTASVEQGEFTLEDAGIIETPTEYILKDKTTYSKKLIEKAKEQYTTQHLYDYVGDDFGYKSICQPVGYWRKANAIHKWFVDNVQNGNDDCSPYEVTKSQLKELFELCFKVISESSIHDTKVAEELLPTTSGFFFGSTEYDEWYFRDLVTTIEIIHDVLLHTDFDNEMIIYVSSW